MSSRTNTTTYFLREPRALEMIRDQVAVPAAAAGRRARVWCVGCSSGDEPYGLAMLCLEAGAPVDILATDINPLALDRARRARYPERNLRHVEAARRARWFTADNTVIPAVAEQVTLLAHDITGEAAPRHDVDVVLCRNVIVYFDAAQLRRAAATMLRALAPTGMLVLGASEWLRAELREAAGAPVVAVDRGRVIVYARTSSPPPPPLPEVPVAAPPAPVPPPPRPAPSDLSALEIDQLRESGDALLDSNRPAEAAARYEAAIARAPLLADLHLRHACCHLQRNALTDARASLRRALFLRPALWPAWLLLADLSPDPTQRLHFLAQARATATDLSDEPALRPFVGSRFIPPK